MTATIAPQTRTTRATDIAASAPSPAIPPRTGAPSSSRAVLVVLLAATLLNGLDASTFTGAAAVIGRELHLGINDIGTIASAFTLFLTISIVPIGVVADRVTRTRVIALCLAVWSVATALTSLAGGFLTLLITRAATGIGEAGYGPAGNALVADVFPEERRGRVMSWLTVGSTVGPILGMVFGGIIAGLMPGAWRFAFLATGLPGLVLAFWAWRLHIPQRREEATSAYAVWQPEQVVASLRALARARTFVCLLIMGVLTTFTATALQTYFPILLQQGDTFGMSSGQAASYAGLALGPIAIVGVALGGYLADVLHHRYAGARILIAVISVLLTAPLNVISLLAMRTHNLALFTALIVPTFFINTLHLAPLAAAIVDVVPAVRRGAAVALVLFIERLLGTALAPAVIGGLARGFDPSGQHFAASLAGRDIIFALICTCPIAFLAAGIAGIVGLRGMRATRAATVAG